jgi:FkbM family methyltransferase
MPSNPASSPGIFYAHAGGDEWILSQFPAGFRGYAVELGAHDGRYISNTFLLEERGWTVLCIEPNPAHEAELRKNRRLVLTCACNETPSEQATLHTYSGVHNLTQTSLVNPGDGQVTVAVRTLADCVDKAGFPRLDVISLDVDGLELNILKGADLARWHPTVIVVENNAGDPLKQYLTGFGYAYIEMRGHNELWRRN